MVKDIPKLKKIYLENNQLTHLPTFYGIFMVFEEIYLPGNFISHIYGDGFENITNIQKIDISNNGLLLFEPQHELSSLGSLNIDNNNLKEIDYVLLKRNSA